MYDKNKYKEIIVNGEKLLIDCKGDLWIIAERARVGMPISIICSRGNINDSKFRKANKFEIIIFCIFIVFCSYLSYKFFRLLI
jgi:hypothetical protein